uniref:NADPH-dependent fmn reductase n=1 Tax=uncultured bacterium 20 TaxID=1748270 RepID=A0A0U3KCV5_9BACT|nr:NADPH-dependent fmn reductase [uncultured bacterium 20]
MIVAALWRRGFVWALAQPRAERDLGRGATDARNTGVTLRPSFRYEQFQSVHLVVLEDGRSVLATFEETPVGNFLGLSGAGAVGLAGVMVGAVETHLFVGGGARAVESLRLVMGEVMVEDVRAQVALSLYTDFENFSVFKPAPHHEPAANAMLDQVIAWGTALKPLRQQ